MGRVNKCTADQRVVLPAFVQGDDTFPLGDRPMLASFEVDVITHKTYQAAPTPAPTSHVDCETTKWTEWTECSQSCGKGGVRTQFRMVITDGFGNGVRCRANCVADGDDYKTEDGKPCKPLHMSEKCNEDKVCPTDCVMSKWGVFGGCDKTCGIGQ